jgi:hypothetical protein
MATPAQVEPAFCIPALNGFRSRLAHLFMELGVKGAPTIPLPSTVLLAAQRLNFPYCCAPTARSGLSVAVATATTAPPASQPGTTREIALLRQSSNVAANVGRRGGESVLGALSVLQRTMAGALMVATKSSGWPVPAQQPLTDLGSIDEAQRGS